jgi:hypothetical protein
MTEIVYKDQIFHLLILLLEHGANQAKNDPDFESDYYKVVSKKLKFQHKTDWQRYQSSVYLLGDTESAIMSAFEYQLGDLSRENKDYGGMHLRLYGILNAVYLQMGAFKEIMNLLNFSGREKINESFKQLDIYKLRGMAGAHTANYEYDKETLKSNDNIGKSTSFIIMQYLLEETGSKIQVIDKNGILFEYNLLKILGEYEKKATDLLVQLIEHSIDTFYKDRESKIEMRDRLKHLLSNLMDYSKMNENQKYSDIKKKEIDELLKDLKPIEDKDLNVFLKSYIPNIKKM